MSLVELDLGTTATITFNDPDRHNSLTLAMFEEIDAALERVENEVEGASLLLRGHGPSFCSGLDILAGDDRSDRIESLLRSLSRVARRLRRMPRVVVAEVHGNALAGGCALLSACDMVCVEPDARIGYPVHQLGLSPAVSIPTLVQSIPAGEARNLMLSGRLIDGREAYRIGLAHHLADSRSELPGLAAGICTELADKGRNALKVTKAWLNEICGDDHDEAFDRTLEASIDSSRTTEATRMLDAFWERGRSRPTKEAE